MRTWARIGFAGALLLTLGATQPGGCGAPVQPPYDACAGKVCGDQCHDCPPGATGCVETMMLKGCDASGKCTSYLEAEASCYDPCAGKACGATCALCPPAATRCPPAGETGACDPEGKCVAVVPACPP
jgi:hypothetical protein